MNREELLKSTSYWTQMLQLDVFELVNSYLTNMNMTRSQFAEKIGVSKGYLSQILNGNFDHKISKLVELALACECVPTISFAPISKAEAVATKTYVPLNQWTPVKYTKASLNTKSFHSNLKDICIISTNKKTSAA